jgi:hypothetical protein
VDPFHERLARLALEAAGPYGFALAGGYAVQAHGFLERPSMDVDIFAGTSPAPDFGGGVDAVVAALRGQGLQVDTELRNARFARLAISSADQAAKMEFGVDWRMNAPVMLPVGPVLHADDAVANKVCALFGRAEVRDYIDVDAILTSGRYTRQQLLDLAADHDPGFDRMLFAEALEAIDRLPASLFEPYQVDSSGVSAICQRMHGWASEIRGQR